MNSFRWFGRGRRGSPFALDLGPEHINLLALQGGERSLPSVALLRSQPLTNLDLLNGSDEDRQEIARELGDLVQLLGLAGRPMRMALPGDAHLIRQLLLPLDLSPQELQERALEQESELYLPYARSDADLDYYPLGPSPSDSGQQAVLLVGTRRQFTDRCLELGERVGCPLQSLEPRCLAIARALRPLLQSLSPQEATLLLYVGTLSSELTVLRHGVPLFNRVMGQGARDLLAPAYPQITQLPWSGILQGGLMTSVDPVQIQTTSRPLAQEINRSVQFLTGQIPDLAVQSLLLCGPGSVLNGLSGALGTQLGLRCEPADPWLLNGIEPPTQFSRGGQEPSQLLTAAGLALKEE